MCCLTGFAGNRVLLFTVTCLMILFVPLTSFAQQDLQDVVYLKNGGIIRGMIIEQIPNVTIKIQTGDGSVFVYQMDEIQKITKEESLVKKLAIVETRPLPNTAYLFQPLGFLQFGPIVEAEIKLGTDLYLTPHFRYSALGLAYVAIASGGFQDEVWMNSMALGVGARRFMENPNSSNRFYYGGFVEYGWGGTSGDIGTSYEWDSTNSQLILLSSWGYRWRYPSGIFMNAGIMAGVAKGIDSGWWYIDNPDQVFHEALPTYFLGGLEFSIGIEK